MQIARTQTPMGLPVRVRTQTGQLWNSIQSWLFPALEDGTGALGGKHRLFVAVCELCAPQDHMAAYRWCGNLPATQHGRQAAARPTTGRRCARRSSPKPCGTSRPRAT